MSRLYDIYHKRPKPQVVETHARMPDWRSIRRRLGIAAANPEVRQYLYDLEHDRLPQHMRRDRIRTFMNILDIVHRTGSQWNVNTMGGLRDMLTILGYTETDKILGEVPFRDPALQARLGLYLRRVLGESLAEAPIGAWDVDPQIDQNQQQMVAKQTGYRQDRDHWDATDRGAMDDPKIEQGVRQAFGRVPQTINLFFWQIPDPDYDKYLQRGMVDLDWVAQNMNLDLAKRIQQSDMDDAITVVMTNNLSDQRKISIRSPWIVGHRIAHAVVGGEKNPRSGERIFSSITNVFDDFTRDIMRYAYDYEWNTWDHRIYQDEMNILKKALGEALGTMKSSRSGHLVSGYEWEYETFTQYLIQGVVTMNSLPDTVGGYRRTSDPVKWNRAQRIIGKFPQRLERWYDQLLEASVGKVFLI